MSKMHLKNQGLFIVLLDCFNDISVNADLVSLRLKSKRQLISTINFYLHDIS